MLRVLKNNLLLCYWDSFSSR